MKIIIGNASKELGGSVVKRLDVEPSSSLISKFTDGEVNVEVANDLCNQEVYILQSLSPPVNNNLIELLFIIDAVTRLGPKKIVVIIPYYGYSRQDRIIKNNDMQSSLNAKLVANLIQTAGANSVPVIDLHSSQIEGFFNIPITNLNCFKAFANCIHIENLAIVAPDIGAISRARSFAKTLEEKYKTSSSYKIIVVDKYREKAGKSQVINVIGEVANKNCVIIDDIVDSGGTLCNAALALKNCGAKSVISCITHGVLSGSAVENISSSCLDKLVITNTILHKLEKTDKIEVVSVVDILTNFIQGGKNAR